MVLRNQSRSLLPIDCHRVLLWMLVALLQCAESHAQSTPGNASCRFTDAPPVIDGMLSDSAWKQAEVIEHFSMSWLAPNATLPHAKTRARLLWDREFFYFSAQMDDSDLFADVVEHDGTTWDNDVFEIFLKPTTDSPGYFEFQVNAAGTVFDMFVPDRAQGDFKRFFRSDRFHVESKVSHQGSLNLRSDTDQGWTVEGRIPWTDFSATGGRPDIDEVWKFALCRYDYERGQAKPELSSTAPLTKPDFHRSQDYGSLRFTGPSSDSPLSRFASQLNLDRAKIQNHVQGSPEPPHPYRVVRVHPELSPSFPIYVQAIPGSKRLLVIDQKWAYGPARLAITTEPSNEELKTVWPIPNEGVAYSLALHPQFQQNGYLYIGWNGNPGGGPKRSIISRFQMQTSEPFDVDLDSEKTIIEWPSDGHNGAAIAFGLDGMLYVTSGDGTSDSDRNLQGQRTDQLLAKVLRIDVDHHDPDKNYSIPADNPFRDRPEFAPETWAYGLRNPWRMAIDPTSGQVWVGNNGQDLWEQVYAIQRGANYGWSLSEGSHPFYPDRQPGPTPISQPTFEHPHSEARSLTGGIVYRGKKLPELTGAYLYADYSTGKIWGAKMHDHQIVWHREIADSPLMITCIAEDNDGELLIADHRRAGEGGFYTLELNPLSSKADENAFPKKLSDTGLFKSLPKHQVQPGLIPYQVNAPLWSDGAHKERFVYIPPAITHEEKTTLATIEFPADNGWNLPNGSVTVKSFSIETIEGRPESRRWIETRLMLKEEENWTGYSYRWNDEQTEAFLVESSGLDAIFQVVDAAGVAKEQPWRYPSRTECLVCHTRAANFVLGISNLQLNRTNRYGQEEFHQLELIERLGVLRINGENSLKSGIRKQLETEHVPTDQIDSEIEKRLKKNAGQRQAKDSTMMPNSPRSLQRLVDPYDPRGNLELRARSYLHANCSVCHVEAGGGNAAIDLDFRKPLSEARVLDAVPLHHRFDLQDARIIAPGLPSQSVLLHRMSIRSSGQMPQLATQRVDHDAVRLIRDWIESLGPKQP